MVDKIGNYFFVTFGIRILTQYRRGDKALQMQHIAMSTHHGWKKAKLICKHNFVYFLSKWERHGDTSSFSIAFDWEGDN